MKYIPLIILSFFVIFTSCKTSHHAKNKIDKPLESKSIVAKEPVKINDSLEYVKSIVADSGKYLNRPLGVLLNDLAIPIKSYTSLIGNERLISRGILVSFDDPNITMNKSEGFQGASACVRFVILWPNPIVLKDVEAQIKRTQGDWGPAEQEYYSKLIVKEIR